MDRQIPYGHTGGVDSQTSTATQAQGHTGHSTKEHTFTTDKTTGLGHTNKVQALGPLHRQQGSRGEGAPDDLPRHRHTKSTQTGRCPQLASQPATGTQESYRGTSMTPHVEHTWQGFHMPHELLTAIQSDPPLPPSSSYTLWSWPPGQGLGHLAGGRWRENGPF